MSQRERERERERDFPRSPAWFWSVWRSATCHWESLPLLLPLSPLFTALTSLFICYSSDISPTIFTLLHYLLLYPFSPSIRPPPCPKFSPSFTAFWSPSFFLLLPPPPLHLLYPFICLSSLCPSACLLLWQLKSPTMPTHCCREMNDSLNWGLKTK